MYNSFVPLDSDDDNKYKILIIVMIIMIIPQIVSFRSRYIIKSICVITVNMMIILRLLSFTKVFMFAVVKNKHELK